MDCQYFPRCKNIATVLVPNAFLGDVPSCDECAKMFVDDWEKLPKIPDGYIYDGMDRLADFIHKKSTKLDCQGIPLDSEKGKTDG